MGGIRTKLNKIFVGSSQSDYDVILLVETWLNKDFFDEEVFDTTIYLVYRKDRDYVKCNCTKGGGIIIAVKRNLISSLCSLSDSDTIVDQLCVQFKGEVGNLLLNLSYIPPCSPDSLYEKHVQNIMDLVSKYSDHELVVFGDFNLSKIIWSIVPDSSYVSPSNINFESEINVIDSFFSLGLVQINNFFNNLGKILDLVFVGTDIKFLINECPFPFCNTDMHHVALELILEFYSYCKVDNKSAVNYDFKHCNFDNVNEIINGINWLQILNCDNVNDNYEIFIDIINEICFENLPRIKPNVYKLPWYTPGLKKLKNLRNKHYNRFKTSNDLNSKQLYELHSREFNFLNKFLYKQYIINFETNIKANPKSFWNFVNSKRTCSQFPTRMYFENSTSNSSTETANLFADFFSSNFVSASNVFGSVSNSSNLNFGMLELEEDDILFGISKLKPTHRIDNDGLCAFFVKNCADSLKFPLLSIFNNSLKEGVFADRWKVTSITPVHKSGAKDNVSNYRPISKLCNISKIFENIVFEKMYFCVKNIISPYQHGFVRGRSTVTNLTIFANYCITGFENGFQIDTVYTDLSKAFDRISHSILLHKLESIGFHSTFLDWIKSYLVNRYYSVSIDSSESYSYIATSGIPQGSTLGPLLFILFINDISALVKWSEVLMYADDLKIFSRIKSISDSLRLQTDLNTIVAWCSRNFLDINVSKCYQVCYTKRKNPISYSYSINDLSLRMLDEITDLGVVFDSNFTFVNHINAILPKSYAMFAFLRRNSKEFSDVYTLKLLYTSLVRSKLEYACIIWYPYCSTHISRVERVQHKFIKYALHSITFLDPPPSYIDRCRFIQLKTLENRRTFLSQLFIYKIIRGFVDCPDLLRLISFHIPPRILRNNCIFYDPVHRTNYSSNELVSRALREFNRISCMKSDRIQVNIDFGDSINVFKDMLDIIYF